MKIAPAIAVIALGAAATAAQAEVTSTITLASDYDFRGITQTARDPALQASLDWTTESGFYLGAWASNVDFGKAADADAEIDVYAGLRGNFSDDLSYDIGAVQYIYNPGGDKVDFTETYASLTYKAVSAKLWYAWDFSNTGKDATYVELNGSVPLPNDFSLALHGGYSSGDYWKGTEYFDYSVGVSKSVGNFALTLKWVDGSDLQSAQKTPDDVFTSENKFVFSVATTLPWGK